MSDPPELRPLSPRRVAAFVVIVFGACAIGDALTHSGAVTVLICGALLYATIRPFTRQ